MKNETKEIVKILEESGVCQSTNKYLIYNEGCNDECVLYDSSLPQDLICKIQLVSSDVTELPSGLTEEERMLLNWSPPTVAEAMEDSLKKMDVNLFLNNEIPVVTLISERNGDKICIFLNGTVTGLDSHYIINGIPILIENLK